MGIALIRQYHSIPNRPISLLEADMRDTIGIVDLFVILKKRWRMIVVFTFIAGLAGGAITNYLLTPIYQTSTQILVNQKKTEQGFDISSMQSSVELINTYSMIIKSPAILEKVNNEYKLVQKTEELEQKISISSQEGSQVFILEVKDSDPVRAVHIANAVSTTFQKEIPKIMNVDNVNILAKAELKEDPDPVSPNLLFNITISIVIGMMAAAAIVLLLELVDKTFKNDQDVEAFLGLPVIGSIELIPEMEAERMEETEVRPNQKTIIVITIIVGLMAGTASTVLLQLLELAF